MRTARTYAHEKQIKAATDFTDYTDFMDDAIPERQQSVKSVKSVAAFKNRRVIFRTATG